MTGAFPEILSPAGNTEMLIAAVRAGANAVYLGAKQFSARRNAVNFSLEELKEAVTTCHIRGVKVYLTLNILIRDEEMADAFSLAHEAYRAGIDGLILADLGLARLLHRDIPALPLHASTQMSVLSPLALPILKQMGFARVVAPRELTKAELSAFCEEAKRLSLEVEVFIHGALCMSVSGQCLLSAFLGGRSGNRGLCAGPCRLPFSAPGGTGHDLSLKDLSLLPYLHELKEMGVSSFKIEGRMKRPEYVAAATAAANAALHERRVPEELEEALRAVFSRSGFTAGYYEDKRGKNMFGIRTKEDVAAAGEAFPLLHDLTRRERQSVPLTAVFTAKANTPLTLTLSDGAHSVTLKGETPQKALQKSASGNSVKTMLDKFGATPYFLVKFTADIEDGLFIRQSDLNDLRRRATEKLNTLRGSIAVTDSPAVYIPCALTPCQVEKSIKLFVRVAKPEQLPAHADGVIFPLEKEWNADFAGQKTVEIPRGFSNPSALVARLTSFYQKGFTHALCGDIASFAAAKSCGFSVIADSGMNILNSEAALTTANMGADSLLVSAEMTAAGLKRFASPVPVGLTVYGHLPLMLFRNCPLKNGSTCQSCRQNGGALTDRTGTRFPVRCRTTCGELYNSVPLWLGDKKEDFHGISFAVLYFTEETKEQVEKTVAAFQNGQKADFPHTRGLFYRGTK